MKLNSSAYQIEIVNTDRLLLGQEYFLGLVDVSTM